MLTLADYKKLVAEHLTGLTEAEIERLYRLDATLALHALKTWRARPVEKDGDERGKMAA